MEYWTTRMWGESPEEKVAAATEVAENVIESLEGLFGGAIPHHVELCARVFVIHPDDQDMECPDSIALAGPKAGELWALQSAIARFAEQDGDSIQLVAVSHA